MGGIQVSAGNAGLFSHPVIWHEIPASGAVFLVIKDGAIGLASEDYITELMAEIWKGDLKREDAWDRLLIQTPEMEAPALCYVETDAEGDGAEGDKVVATFRSGTRLGPIRLRIQI